MSEVVVETVSRTRIVTINRPEARNALTRAVITGVRDAFLAAAGDESVRCVVLTGAGGHFCAGADLRKNMMENPDLLEQLDAYMDEYHAVIKAIVRCPKPSIAMLDGCAVGFGADLALACDLRVATPSAYVQEKFVKIGLMPDGGGTFWLPRLVGTARALRWMFFAEKIEGPELASLGLVMKLAPPSELREATLAIARELEKGPPLAFAQMKQAVYGSWGELEDALRREREGQLKLLRSQDAMEGIMAWVQKREPSFQGK
ncbi:MAG: enoyl-CoA hydratase/isomerase family protein [Polyangiaceae bacterium]